MFGALAAIIALMGASAASAATVTYNISGNFDAPATGSFSGSVTFDNVTGDVSAITLTTTAGKADDGVTDLPGNTHIFTGYSAHGIVATFATSLPPTGHRGGSIAFFPLLSSGAPGVAYLTEALCTSDDCGSFLGSYAAMRTSDANPITFTPVSPPPAPVPTLSEWAMILLGLMMAGGAALHLGRRRMV